MVSSSGLAVLAGTLPWARLDVDQRLDDCRARQLLATQHHPTRCQQGKRAVQGSRRPGLRIPSAIGSSLQRVAEHPGLTPMCIRAPASASRGQ
jgi:hypothetical protein